MDCQSSLVACRISINATVAQFSRRCYLSVMKKTMKDWHVALIHFLLAGILFPLISGIVIAFILARFLGRALAPSGIAAAIISILVIWIGIRYSVRLLRQKYEISNPQNVSKLAAIFYFLIPTGLGLFAILNIAIIGAPESSDSELIVSFFQAAIGAVVMYFESKRQFAH